jgi:hypothetical protein
MTANARPKDFARARGAAAIAHRYLKDDRPEPP